VLLLEQAPVALKVVLNIDPARKAMLLAVAPLAILLAVAPLAILLAVAPLAMVLSEVTSPVEDDANGMDDAARQRTTRTAASHTRPVCISLSAMAFHPLLPAQRPRHGSVSVSGRREPPRLRSSNSNPITCSGGPSARVLLVRAHLLVAYCN
jgi:hypothetical protein